MTVTRRQHIEALARLDEAPDAAERVARFRKGLATLAATVQGMRRSLPLEGIRPDRLLTSVRAAFAAGLFEDLDWLSPAARVAALHELSAALPTGVERRALEQRGFDQAYAGNAETFIALATRLALRPGPLFGGPGLRARVGLALDLPLGAKAGEDALALALVSHRELRRRWLTERSIGALPSRRLAARLLERAAREASARALEGDDSGASVFTLPDVEQAWSRLLHDREPLVWRHAAVARGLLVDQLSPLAGTIQRDLSPSLSTTEWRRGAASLTASVAIRPEESLAQCRGLLAAKFAKQDRGVALAVTFGLPRVAEVEPGAADELLQIVARRDEPWLGEVAIDLLRERPRPDFAHAMARDTLDRTRDALARGDAADGPERLWLETLSDELRAGLDAAPCATPPASSSLAARVDHAVATFQTQGSPEAAAHATAAVGVVEALVRALAEAEDAGREGARFAALRQLDRGLLQSDALVNALALEEPVRGERVTMSGRDRLDPQGSSEAQQRLGAAFDALSARVVRAVALEADEPSGYASMPPVGRTRNDVVRLGAMRALVHVVDVDGPRIDADPDRLRERRLKVTQGLLRAIGRGASWGVVADDETARRRRGERPERGLIAATARAVDGLVREDLVELSDVLLAVSHEAPDRAQVLTLAEATMDPDIEAMLRAHAALLEATEQSVISSSLRPALDALMSLSSALPVARSPRVEVLRMALIDLVRGLHLIRRASSLAELAAVTRDRPLGSLERAVDALGRLTAGAARRAAGLRIDQDPAAANSIYELDLAIERCLAGGSRDQVDAALEQLDAACRFELPRGLGALVEHALDRLRELPLDGPRRLDISSVPAPLKEPPLPAWVPPNRVLGGFYIARSIGMGAVGSVFVAHRVESRLEPTPESFALKVPEYSGEAARQLSEEEFLRLFREEAAALLGLPSHPNLARFVTFDAGALPKPILVMELVDGLSLERSMQVSPPSKDRAFDILDGVAAGLEALHRLGLGHLDVKPSNIIVRATPDATPVLVDFGLAGRHIRPGCATAAYGAPEVWGNDPDSAPTAADVYSFACLAYEVLAGEPLFQSSSDVGLITQHVTHDGSPERVQALCERDATEPLGRALSAMLRRDPAHRPTIGTARSLLEQARGVLAWPLR